MKILNKWNKDKSKNKGKVWRTALEEKDSHTILGHIRTVE